MLDGRVGETFVKKGSPGRPQTASPTRDESQNIGGVCRSFRVAGQVKHSEKRDRQGGEKLLLLTIDLAINVGGVCRLSWMAG